jgi:hypothetical protein
MLERAQKGTMNVSLWLAWYLENLGAAIKSR